MMLEPVIIDAGSIIGYGLGGLLSVGVLSAGISALVGWLNNRRNARIQERKNTADEGNDLVARYKEAAAEERAAKDSAVATVQTLLAIAQGQIDTLKDTIQRLTSTIEALQKSAATQVDLIQGITDERDLLQTRLVDAVKLIDDQKAELLQRQHEILELSYPSVNDALNPKE